MPIYQGPNRIDRITVGRPTDAEAIEQVYLGQDIVYQTYREEEHTIFFSTDGYAIIDGTRSGVRQWTLDVPEWATAVDVVGHHSGETGQNGSRGIGNNDGRGGFARRPLAQTATFDRGQWAARVQIGDPNLLTGNHRMPDRTQMILDAPGQPSVTMLSPDSAWTEVASSGSTGASTGDITAYGRTFAGGAGGSRDNPGGAPGGGGGGGEGAPLVGGSTRPGRIGGGGRLWLRFRSGPKPS